MRSERRIARLFPDVDFDGDVDASDKALHPSLPPAYGWAVPVAGNVFRKVQLRTDVGLEGLHILALKGSGFRVWRSANPGTNDVPLLVGGQAATNGVGGVSWDASATATVYVEAVTNGTARLTYAFLGVGAAAGVVSRASLKMAAVSIASIELVGAPEDGLVVLNGSQVVMKANILPVNHPLPENEPKWFYQKLSSDGSWGSWIPFGGLAHGTMYAHETTQSGIFRVKAVLTINRKPFGEKMLVRKTNEMYGPGTVGAPDAFGVVDTQIQIAIRNAAKGFLGSTNYPLNGVVSAQYGFPEYKEGTYKCNIFVAHRAMQAGANVPAINGIPATYPPLANEWAGTEDTHPFVAGFQNDIENWYLMTNPLHPQPGFIVARPATSGSGHCGIVDYDGNGIAAGQENVNKNYLLFLDGTSGFRTYAP
jgi:hypothetical protein